MEKSDNSLKMADSLQDTNNNLIFMEDRSGRSKDVKTFDDKDNDQVVFSSKRFINFGRLGNTSCNKALEIC